MYIKLKKNNGSYNVTNKVRQLSPKPVTEALVYNNSKVQCIFVPIGLLYNVEELPHNMYCICSITENIIIEVPQKIPISAFSASNDYNFISIIISLNHLL